MTRRKQKNPAKGVTMLDDGRYRIRVTVTNPMTRRRKDAQETLPEGATLSAGTGIAFAVPSKVLRLILERMEEEDDGYVVRGFMGVRLVPLDPLASASVEGGAMVQHVKPDTPASEAGLADGDVVVAYNDRRVPDAYTLFDWITYSRPGDRVALDVLRAGSTLRLAVEIGEVELPGAMAAADDGELPEADKAEPVH